MERSWRAHGVSAFVLTLLTVCLSGCGTFPDVVFDADSNSGDASQSSTVQRGSAELTVEQYAVECADYRAAPLQDYATNFDAVSDLKYMADGLKGMSPPSEVAAMHRARISMIDTLIYVLSQQPPDYAPELFVASFRYPELVTTQEDFNASQYTLSIEARESLVAQGCLGSEDEVSRAQATVSAARESKIEEYARWCGESELPRQSGFPTARELTFGVSNELTRYEEMSPPPELKAIHDARAALFRTVVEVYGEFSPDTSTSGNLYIGLEPDFWFVLGRTLVRVVEHPEFDARFRDWVSAYNALEPETLAVFSKHLCGMYHPY